MSATTEALRALVAAINARPMVGEARGLIPALRQAEAALAAVTSATVVLTGRFTEWDDEDSDGNYYNALQIGGENVENAIEQALRGHAMEAVRSARKNVRATLVLALEWGDKAE